MFFRKNSENEQADLPQLTNLEQKATNNHQYTQMAAEFIEQIGQDIDIFPQGAPSHYPAIILALFNYLFLALSDLDEREQIALITRQQIVEKHYQPPQFGLFYKLIDNNINYYDDIAHKIAKETDNNLKSIVDELAQVTIGYLDIEKKHHTCTTMGIYIYSIIKMIMRHNSE